MMFKIINTPKIGNNNLCTKKSTAEIGILLMLYQNIFSIRKMTFDCKLLSINRLIIGLTKTTGIIKVFFAY